MTVEQRQVRQTAVVEAAKRFAGETATCSHSTLPGTNDSWS